MLSFALNLNHMTVPSLTMKNVGDLARSLGMGGIELRNDLEQPLFDGQAPNTDMVDGLNVIALAEVKAFNAFDDATFDRSVDLMYLAVACGAKAIALIPQVGGDAVSDDGSRTAMAALAPELASRGLVGLIEPIGFHDSTLRDLRGGYTGPLSFEAFSPNVHALIDPKAALSRSTHFIENEILAHAA